MQVDEVIRNAAKYKRAADLLETIRAFEETIERVKKLRGSVLYIGLGSACPADQCSANYTTPCKETLISVAIECIRIAKSELSML